jgi:hypothetical protein
LDLIWQHEDGQAVVIELLSMRFHGLEKNHQYIVSDLLKNKSASFLASCVYSRDSYNTGISDYNLTQIANVSLSSNESTEYALIILNNIKSKILEHVIGRYDFPEFMSTIIQLHPILALDVFIGEDADVDYQVKNAIKGRFDKKVSPFSKVDIKSTLKWCNDSREERYPKLASIITPHQNSEESIEWTPLAIELLKNCPESTKVLDEFLSSFCPNGWTGSRAKILESRLPLFNQLIDHPNRDITTWVTEEKAKWQKFIASEYESERESDIDKSERFEW